LQECLGSKCGEAAGANYTYIQYLFQILVIVHFFT
jgi:hypothetical protein